MVDEREGGGDERLREYARALAGAGGRDPGAVAVLRARFLGRVPDESPEPSPPESPVPEDPERLAWLADWLGEEATDEDLEARLADLGEGDAPGKLSLSALLGVREDWHRARKDDRLDQTALDLLERRLRGETVFAGRAHEWGLRVLPGFYPRLARVLAPLRNALFSAPARPATPRPPGTVVAPGPAHVGRRGTSIWAVVGCVFFVLSLVNHACPARKTPSIPDSRLIAPADRSTRELVDWMRGTKPLGGSSGSEGPPRREDLDRWLEEHERKDR